MTDTSREREHDKSGKELLWLVIASVIPYLPAINFPFIYDDIDGIANNQFIRNITDLKTIFVNNGARPILFFTFAINYAISGLNTWSYHLANILIHAVTVVLAFICLSSILKSIFTKEKAGQIALFTSLIFALHPIQTETVIYIISRSEGLSSLLYLAALLSFLRFREAKFNKNARLYYCLIWAFFLPALLIKETIATLPMIILLLDLFWLSKNNTVSGGDKPKKAAQSLSAPSRSKLLLPHLPFWCLLIAGMAWRLYRLPAEINASPLPRSVTDNLLAQANAIVRYLGLLLFPARQSIAHGYFMLPPEFDPSFALSIVFLIALFITAVIAFKKYPWFTFGIGWFFIIIAPSSSFFPLQEVMVEHRLYLPALGIFLIIAIAFDKILSHIQARFPFISSNRFFALIAVILAVITFSRGSVWATEESIWQDALEKNPDYWGSHYVLGDYLRSKEEYEKAIPHYFNVLALHGEDPDALINLGICYFELGERDKAPNFWYRGLKAVDDASKYGAPFPGLDIAKAKLYNNLGRYHAIKNERDQAKQFYELTLELFPYNPTALKGLGLLSLKDGRYQEARRYFEQASWYLPKGSPERLELEKFIADLAKLSPTPVQPSSPYD